MTISKLKNIKAVGELLQGNHRTQTRKTFGYADVDSVTARNEKHEVGDVWIETHPVTGVQHRIEQKDGYRVKTSLNLGENAQDIRQYLNTFQKCPKEICTCKNPTSLDTKFKNLMGMCHDCVLTMETRLKIGGKFDEYALDKMKNNAKVFLKQSDQEVEELKAALLQPLNFVEGADGRTETWSSDNKQFLIDQIDKQYNQFKNDITEKLGEL
jgi:hypothetical protein